MSLAAAYTNLAALLTTHADLVTWATGAGGTLHLIKGNRDVSRIDPAELPAIVLEVGKLPTDPVVGGFEVEGRHEMHASFVWHEEDEATAFERKVALMDLLPQVVMSAADLSGAVQGAWVGETNPDLGYNHPRHSVGFTVRAELNIAR